VYSAAQIALAIVVKDKNELLKLVANRYETFGPALMELANASASAAALQEVIGSAEARLAVALAVIEGDGGGDGGDGGLAWEAVA
jgi:NAD(P)H-hydrate repair Nnr-like enzyme with NAD(P)H-hydrate epimerase domain